MLERRVSVSTFPYRVLGWGPAVIALFVLPAACTTAPQPPSPLEAQGYSAEQLWPLRKAAKTGVPLVPVDLAGKETWLVLDTANMSGLAVGPEVVRRLDLRAVAESPDRDSSGAVIGHIPVYRVDNVVAFGRGFANRRAVHYGDDAFHGARQGEGLLGPAYLAERCLTFDYRNNGLAVADVCVKRSSDEDTLELVTVPGLEGMPVVRGKVHKREVFIQVDTGKSRTVVDPKLVAELGLPEVPGGRLVTNLQLGSFEFSVPSAKVVSLRGISRGLDQPILVGVGSDILSQVVWTLDYRRKVIVLHRS